ncbi:Por secretion system C-terminal sorting domain-containing protein [Aquiflexum balticum DSM 16537]|uniref:Por secretion system C-terminal sorting domain-containing protein n=1 Tax=Aquiflexum balticum DSM 16537 TaxID=758820 RepID=A0A1W2HBQ4_9BACT|nr:LamG-like jellyroll fold domain-containing protein [Aquiflexum balticum]SMD46299.1 Por secretion system C-terminal sorting domain-containing protein [Aquiflexum balticum DSM 16537]
MKNLFLFQSIKILTVFVGLMLITSFELRAQSVEFDLSTLNFNGFTPPSQGTSLKFGPDNRLYLARRRGEIQIYRIENTGNNIYSVVDHEILFDVKSIPNHDDIGTPAWNGRSDRQITGIEVVGTPENPIIYVGSSDPTWGGPSGDKVLDTNSGIITKLTWNGNSWDVVDLVRGLPRSEENHSTNAVEFTIINNKPYLLVASGGFTNAGSPSTNFTWITEYALSAALLSIDLDAIESMPIQIDPSSGRQYKYDIPTLDDPSRPNLNGIYDPNHPDYDGIDVGDPWGGNDGLNMAMVVEGGPVQIFSAGYRNAYDFVVTEAGKVFITDNGPNANWGGLPENEGNPSTVTNNYLTGEPGGNSTNKSASGEHVRNQDHILLITQDIQSYQPGAFYGGHPTPIRANPGVPYSLGASFPFNPGGAGLYTKSIGDDSNWTNLSPLYTPNEIFRTQVLAPIAPGEPGFDAYAQTTLPVNWPPVPLILSNPAEADYRDPAFVNPNGPQPEFVTIWKKNSNGIDEYKASNFGGALKGALIGGRNEGFLHLVRLNPDGSLLSLEEDKWNLNGGNALGITCQGDEDIFPGTIWVATFDNRISILTPSNNPFCPLPDDPFFDPNADYDNDGFTNQDEIDNGTDYCSGASRPNDFDGDFVSDLNDLDDDGDGIWDELDPFQLGSPSDLPINNELFSDKTDELGRPFGYRGLGLTGLMNNGAPNPNWLNWLDKINEGPLPDDIYGGAAGAIQIAMTGGTANGLVNNQKKGFQFGVNVGTETGEFLVIGGLLGFQGPQMFYDIDHDGELGIQMGDGSQSNFLKLVFTKTGIMAALEIDDLPDPNPLLLPLEVEDRPLSSETVEFMFRVNPNLGTAEPQIKIGNRPIISMGTIVLSGKILEAVQDIAKPLAIGVYGSSADETKEFLSIYDYFKVYGERPFVINPLLDITRQVGSPQRQFDLNDYFDDHNFSGNLIFTLTNTNEEISAVIQNNQLILNFPENPASGTITIKAANPAGFFIEQSFDVQVIPAEQIVFRINAGGEVLEGQNDSPNWRANNVAGNYSGDGYAVNTGLVNPSDFTYANKHTSIPEYIDEITFAGIFAQERESEGEDNMIFSIPASNSIYKIRLYFGNSDAGTSNIGDRIFDLKIEEQIVQSDFDFIEVFGHQVGGMVEFQISVTDWFLNIEFIKKIGNPAVNAIEILDTTPAEPIVIINPIPDQINTVNENLAGDLLFTATGGVGTLHYSASNLPPGVDIESVNGRLYGKVDPSALPNSPYSVTLFVTDSNSPVPNQEFMTFTWTILPFDSWNILNEDQNYSARHENAFVQAGEAFYLMGGRGNENSRTIDIYNYQQDSWNSLVNIAPKQFNHFQATEYKGYIWVIGAFETNNFPNEEPASHVWIFDPVNQQYFQGPEIPADRRRGSAGLVVYNDKFYMVAGNRLGHNAQYVSYFDEFDPATGEWTILPDAPRPRDHFHATVIGTKMYVASGRQTGGITTFGPVIREVDVYDFETGTWSTLPSALDIPTPRAGAVVANFQNKLFVAGGEIPGGDNTDALDITEIFDPQEQTWTTGPRLNFKRHGTQGIVSGDGLFVAAGSPIRGSGNQKNMEFFGLNNPQGTAILKSTLSGPEIIQLPGENVNVELSVLDGNQGVFIRNISFTGTDAAEFNLGEMDYSGALILPNTLFNLTINYLGTKGNPEANLLVEFGVNDELLIPIDKNTFSVESFTLINPENTLDILNLGQGSILFLDELGNQALNFRANTDPIVVGSVFLSLNGPVSLSRFDEGGAYTLLFNEGINLGIGEYTLTATPYSEPGGAGTAGTPLSINFTVIASSSNLPDIPSLTSPSNGAINQQTTVDLVWTSISNADSYRIQLASDIEFDSVIAEEPAHPTNSFTTPELTANTTYFWRVLASNVEGDSDWSETRSFTTEEESVVNPDEDLVGHWKMDEGSGNVLIDHSGNGNNATIQNTANVFWEPGIIGLAVNFNSWSGRYGVAPHSQSLEIAEALSIVSWVKPTSVGRNTIISKADRNGFELWLDQNGQIEFRLNRGNNGAAYRLLSNYNYTGDVGEWIHVAATFDGTTSRIFINGIEDISATYAPFTIGTASGDLTIGSLGTVQRFNGAIDDLRLYGRALDGSEIFGLFAGEIPLPVVPQLLAPADGNASVIAPEVQLAWLTSDFAAGYQVQLATDIGFGSMVADVDNGPDIIFNATGLLPETAYFWRVRAYNGEGSSDWSETRSFATVADGQVPDGPVGHWKMDEGSGNVLIDHSGNGNNATIQNTANVFWEPGIIGLAVNFNSWSGRYGVAPHSQSLEIAEALSIVSWVKPRSVGRNTIISKADGNGFELWLDQNGQIEFRLNRGNNGAAYRLLSNYNYTGDVGEWIHVAATFDGTTSRIFINGIEDISATYSPFTIGTASGDLTIGALGTIQRFNGAIDDLRLYGRALDISEITDLYTNASNIARKSAGSVKGQINDEAQLSIEDPENDAMFGFKIYPNPVEDRLHIHLNSREEIPVDIVVYDMMGRQYINRSAVPENGEIVLDLAPVRMAAGTYLLILDQGQGRMKQVKFIKK